MTDEELRALLDELEDDEVDDVLEAHGLGPADDDDDTDWAALSAELGAMSSEDRARALADLLDDEDLDDDGDLDGGE